MAINLTDKLYAATGSQVIADAIQVAGGYMAITSDQRAKLTPAQKVAGTLVYETDTNKTYRYIETAPDTYEWIELVQKQGDWNQPDETAPDYIKNKTHYEIDAEEIITLNAAMSSEGDGFHNTYYAGYFDTELSADLDSLIGTEFTVTINGSTTYSAVLEYGLYLDEYPIYYLGDWMSCLDGDIPTFGAELYRDSIIVCLHDFYYNNITNINVSLRYSQSRKELKQLDDKFIPDTIARVDQYDKYGKDSFSANATAKAISAKSAAFGFNTQAGSFAYTVTALDPVAKTFTLDSVEGLEVDDIYTVDLSFYKADGTATEEIYANYGKITAISADNVVTVDTFPSDVARYRVPDEPYIDENGLDGEENVFRVIAKPNVGNRAIGTKSFAIGNSSQALSKNSVAMGKACIAYGAHSVAIGYDNKTAYAATSFGRSNTASGVKSVAIGYNNTSSGEGSIAFGNSNISSSKGSFASGTSNNAIGINSFAAGHSNKVQGKYSIALGYNNTSSGEGSTAFGNSNTASNKGSFASGTGNKAIGTNSFALGSTNRATGTSSFAHGYNNDATQTGSAVFGTNSKSQGESSFAAGAAVEASGHYSQAFGQKTKAIGACSFAEGKETIANGKHQHVQGKYNIEDTENRYAHIVGNGTDNGNRSNAHTLDWDGNAWFAGAVSASSIKIGEIEFTADQLTTLETKISNIESKIQWQTF